MLRLLLVTDRARAPRPLPALVSAALSAAPPGAVAVQLREKDLGGRALSELARALLPICRQRGAPLLVNGRIDVALALGLDGVHLPQGSFQSAEARRLLGPRWVGVSCHGLAEVALAVSGGADYATFGPVFATESKRAYGAPVGPARLAEATALGLPLFGLGGVTRARVAELRACGAQGVGAIGAWQETADPAAAVAALLAAWEA